jgi:uncharacterized protein YjbJ (UPF0337 family)
MSIKGQIKEAAGFVQEETGEKLGDKAMANKGRDLRNEGRVEDLKAPKLTPVGETKKHNS